MELDFSLSLSDLDVDDLRVMVEVRRGSVVLYKTRVHIAEVAGLASSEADRLTRAYYTREKGKGPALFPPQGSL